MHAVRDERVDEILVSTFPEQRGSSWLRRDVVGRLRREAKVPVEHVVVDVAAEVATHS
jgi:energy-converting hydrogenase A subunit M